LPDADDDGVVDGADPCPTRPARLDREKVLIPYDADSPSIPSVKLVWNGQDYFAVLASTQYRGRLLRLSRDGEVLQNFGEVNRTFDSNGSIEPLWYGDRYRLFHLQDRGRRQNWRNSRLAVSELSLRGVWSGPVAVDLGDETVVRHYAAVMGIRRGHTFHLALRGTNFGNTPSRFVSLPGVLPEPVLINNEYDEADYWAVSGDVTSPNIIVGNGLWVNAPNDGAAYFTLEGVRTVRLWVSIFDGAWFSLGRNVHRGGIHAVGVGRSLWGAYTRAGNTALEVRRFDLTDLSTDPGLTVADTRGEPGSPKLVYTGKSIEVFWLQTVGTDRLLFRRGMTLEGEFIGPPVALTRRNEPVTSSIGAAWDGERTALLYGTGDGLVFERGDVECW